MHNVGKNCRGYACFPLMPGVACLSQKWCRILPCDATARGAFTVPVVTGAKVRQDERHARECACAIRNGKCAVLPRSKVTTPCPPHGRGDGAACSVRSFRSCTVASTSLLPWGEGQDEGRFPQFDTPSGLKRACAQAGIRGGKKHRPYKCVPWVPVNRGKTLGTTGVIPAKAGIHGSLKSPWWQMVIIGPRLLGDDGCDAMLARMRLRAAGGYVPRLLPLLLPVRLNYRAALTLFNLAASGL